MLACPFVVCIVPNKEATLSAPYIHCPRYVAGLLLSPCLCCVCVSMFLQSSLATRSHTKFSAFSNLLHNYHSRKTKGGRLSSEQLESLDLAS